MVQGQLTIATSQQPSGSSSTAGKRSSKPLVTRKPIINKDVLSSPEDMDKFDEWTQDMADDMDLLMTGAKSIMLDAEKQTQPMKDSRHGGLFE